MRYIICISLLVLAWKISAQGSTCVEANGDSFKGSVLTSTKEQIVLKTENTEDVRAGLFATITQFKSMGINNGTMSWGKQIAEGKIVKVSGNTVTIGELKRESQDGVLFILDRILDVKIDEVLEVKLLQENPCYDTMYMLPGYALGCNCKGTKQGEWRYYSEDGNLLRIEHFDKDGTLSGAYRAYENGKVQMEGEYLAGTRVRQWTKYYPDGRVFQQMNFDTLGRLQGAQRELDERGRIRIAIERLQDYPTARFLYTLRDEYGAVRFVCRFNEARMLVDSLEIFDANQLRTRALLIQGNTVSDLRYHEDGTLRSVESYDLGSHPINWFKKDDFGMLHAVDEPQFSGLKTGNWQTFRPGGELSWQGSYLNDAPHGKWEKYQNGVLVGVEHYDMGARSGEWISFGPQSTVEWKANYHADKLHGESLENYPNGKPKRMANYSFDALTGSYSAYYENGQLMESGTYGAYSNVGMREGAWITYYPDGQRQSQGSYLKDTKIGTWFYWDEKGKKRKEKHEE